MVTPSFVAPAGAHALWQERLALLLESTGEGIFGIDLAGQCVFINRAGAQSLGYDPAEVVGRNMHALTHHSHADGRPYPDADCPIFNAFRQGLPCRIDTEVFWRRDGSAFAVEYSSHPILDDGQVAGAVITFVDISSRKAADAALRRAHDELAQANALLARSNDELEQRVQARTQALSEALVQLRELSAHSDSVRENERTRIAREVHDELGSLLVALKMDVTWLDRRLGEQAELSDAQAQSTRAQMRCKCQHMSRLIESAVDNVGRIITDLRPSILDHQGLWAALEWQAHEFVHAAELQLLWQAQVPAGLDLPEATALAVFRIFQEMLSNVGRHAQATQVQVNLVVAPTPQGVWLDLDVVDNGIGAPPQALDAPQSYGVMGMRERARHLGGALQIVSEPGQGTRVRLQIPVAPSNPNPGQGHQP